MQKEITDQYQHHYVYQLEKQTAGTYTDQNINSFDGRRIKSFQYQLFPQAEKNVNEMPNKVENNIENPN